MINFFIISNRFLNVFDPSHVIFIWAMHLFTAFRYTFLLNNDFDLNFCSFSCICNIRSGRQHVPSILQVKLTKIIDLIDNNDEENTLNCDAAMPIQFDNGEWDAMSTAGDYLLIVCTILMFPYFQFVCDFPSNIQYYRSNSIRLYKHINNQFIAIVATFRCVTHFPSIQYHFALFVISYHSLLLALLYLLMNVWFVWLWNLFFSDCTRTGVKQLIHNHSHSTNSGNNNNSSKTNNSKHSKQQHQFSIGEDGPTITEDDLDILINQSINEWQQRQKKSGDEVTKLHEIIDDPATNTSWGPKYTQNNSRPAYVQWRVKNVKWRWTENE